MYLEICVPFPISNGNTPVALGSKVPVCPTFSFNIFFAFLTISCDVQFLGLFIIIIPSILLF